MVLGLLTVIQEMVAEAPDVDQAGALLAGGHHLAVEEVGLEGFVVVGAGELREAVVAEVAALGGLGGLGEGLMGLGLGLGLFDVFEDFDLLLDAGGFGPFSNRVCVLVKSP